MKFNDLTKEEMLSEVTSKVAKYGEVVIDLNKKDQATKQDLYLLRNKDGSDCYGATPSTIENLWFNKCFI